MPTTTYPRGGRYAIPGVATDQHSAVRRYGLPAVSFDGSDRATLWAFNVPLRAKVDSARHYSVTGCEFALAAQRRAYEVEVVVRATMEAVRRYGAASVGFSTAGSGRRYDLPSVTTSMVVASRRYEADAPAVAAVPRRGRWSLSADASLAPSTPDVSLWHGGDQVAITDASVAMPRGAWGWEAEIHLADPGELSRFGYRDPVTLIIGDQNFDLVVDDDDLSRDGVRRPTGILRAVSPAVRYLDADALNARWAAPQAAEGVVVGLIGGVVWEVPRWIVPAGALEANEERPLEVARRVLQDARALLRSRPDGQLVARREWPVSVPSWSAATPALVLDADRRQLSVGHGARGERWDAVDIRANDAAIEIDQKDAAKNAWPGDTLRVTAYTGGSTVITDAASFHGVEVVLVASGEVTLEQCVAFDHAASATLERPAVAIESASWQGVSLGRLHLSADGRSVIADVEGVALAHVTYTTRALVYEVTIPETVSCHQLLISLTGEAGLHHYGRGPAETKAPEVTVSMLSGAAIDARGEAELDAGAGLRESTVTTDFLPVADGALIEVTDNAAGETWRGIVQGIEHRAEGAKTTTQLTVDRL